MRRRQRVRPKTGGQLLVPSSSLLHRCLGVWQQTGSPTYPLKHRSGYFDRNGNLLGTVIIRGTIRLGPDGKSFSGSSTDDAFDTSGNFLGEETATVAGKRITVN